MLIFLLPTAFGIFSSIRLNESVMHFGESIKEIINEEFGVACMTMGAAVSTVYYNLKLRHPTMDMPIINYDLAVLIQPMLMLGISIGVTFNVLFSDWMVTILLIILFIIRRQMQMKGSPVS